MPRTKATNVRKRVPAVGSKIAKAKEEKVINDKKYRYRPGTIALREIKKY